MLVAVVFSGRKTVMLAGQLMTGGVLSITVTVCVAVAVLPAPSVAVQMMVVVPTGNVMPGLLVRSGMTAWQFASADADWAGTLMTGGAVSLTVTVCVHDSVPELFDAVHVTLVTPDGKAALSGLPSLRELVTVTLSPVV